MVRVEEPLEAQSDGCRVGASEADDNAGKEQDRRHEAQALQVKSAPSEEFGSEIAARRFAFWVLFGLRAIKTLWARTAQRRLVLSWWSTVLSTVAHIRHRPLPRRAPAIPTNTVSTFGRNVTSQSPRRGAHFGLALRRTPARRRIERPRRPPRTPCLEPVVDSPWRSTRSRCSESRAC